MELHPVLRRLAWLFMLLVSDHDLELPNSNQSLTPLLLPSSQGISSERRKGTKASEWLSLA